MSDNKFKDFVQSKTGTVLIVGVIAFGIGFFSGTEYIKYELRKAFSSVSDTFSSSFVNTNSSSPINTPPKSKNKVDFQQSAEVGNFRLKIEKTEWIDQANTSYGSTYKPINKYFVVTFSGENIGSKSSSIDIDDFDLVDEQEKQFKTAYLASSVAQLSANELPAGYSGCLSCSVNPGDKAMQRIYFDIKQGDQNKYKIVNDDLEFLLK